MASNSPPPNTSPAAVPPTSTAIPPLPPPPPPQPSSPPPTTSPPPQPTANPPDSSTPSTPSPPLQSPVASSPPLPQQTISPTSPPPPSNSTSPSPPTSNPPLSSPPPGPPPANSPPPPPPVPNPPTSSPPPPVSNPPTSSPPPPVSNPPRSSPPPPVSNPPTSSPPPPVSNPPTQSPPPRSPPPPPNSPPSPPSDPPTNSPPPSPPSIPPSNLPPPPPPPLVDPPKNSPPPPPPSVPPKNSPPPPSSSPPKNSPPPPVAVPPSNAPPPPTRTAAPTSPLVPPPSNPSPPPPPPPSKIRLSPPPGILFPPTENTPGNNSNPSSPEISNSPSNNGIGTAGSVAIAVAVGIIAFSLIGLVVWCLRRRKKEVSGLNGVYVMPSPMASSPSPTSDSSYTKTQSSAPLIGSGSGSDFVNSPKDPGGLGNSRSLFTYEELVKATNGFSAENLLGEGGFGSVYKGYLPDGREVAIKQLKIGGGQGEREFKAEVEIISRIHHRHLVSLVGYCISDHRRLLIYDYVPNDTLYYHLHRKQQLSFVGEGRPVLDWATRVKIAAGAARGLAYLHEDCHPRIIHRDIKSSNILLDKNFEAQVSDFGLAKLALDANTHVTTRVMGTFGYMAPEYASSGKLTEKSDVFSFGVVLLELITGRKPVDGSQPLGDESLVEWARPLLSHALENEEFDALADPRLGKNYVESEMFRMIEAAAACVRHSAAKRPRMGQVVRAFDSLAASDLSNGMKVGESEVFHSAQQSAEIRWFQRMAFGSQNYSTDFFTQGSLDG